MKEKNKLIMLNEYEKQVTNLFYQFKNNKISLNSLINYFNKLNKIWNVSRVDVKNFGTSENTVEFIEYDKKVNVYFPDWFSNDLGKGSKIEYTNKKINIMFKCISKGELNIILKGVDFRDIINKNTRIPIFLNFKKFIVNDNLISEDLLVWHNKPFIFKKDCENQEIFTARFELETLFDYYPKLNQSINTNLTRTEIESYYSKIKFYIHAEKAALNILPNDY